MKSLRSHSKFTSNALFLCVTHVKRNLCNQYLNLQNHSERNLYNHIFLTCHWTHFMFMTIKFYLYDRSSNIVQFSLAGSHQNDQWRQRSIVRVIPVQLFDP